MHEPVRQPGSDERFYFVMTDRFANGDPANDEGGLTGDRLATGFDPSDKGFYQGGDLAGLRQNLDYIEDLGTTAIWLTPSFLNRPVQGEGADVSAGYHGYWITDFTRIDPHLGTNAELEALIDDAHARGLKVYFDIITNHTADVVDYVEGTYDYVDQATAPYKDADGNPFDPADHAGTGSFPALDAATSFPYTPVIESADQDVKVPAWLNDPTLYHNRGNSTWEGESVTYGDFSGLDDLMTEHPTVVDGFEEIYQAWIDLGIDGFRIDTVKHVNFEFWEEWSTEIQDYARAHGKDEFFTFGEVYDADAAKTSPYVRRTDMSSVLDFSFQSAATSYASGNSAQRLADLYASDDLYTTPHSSGAALPTFLGNHDMGRVGYMLAGCRRPARARRAGARAHVPHARPAGRLLRRRAGLRGHRRRQGRPADPVRDPGRRVREPAPGDGRAGRERRPVRHRRAALRAHRGPRRPPRGAPRARDAAPRSSATPTTAPASTRSPACTATSRSSTWSPRTTRARSARSPSTRSPRARPSTRCTAPTRRSRPTPTAR